MCYSKIDFCFLIANIGKTTVSTFTKVNYVFGEDPIILKHFYLALMPEKLVVFKF